MPLKVKKQTKRASTWGSENLKWKTKCSDRLLIPTAADRDQMLERQASEQD